MIRISKLIFAVNSEYENSSGRCYRNGGARDVEGS